MSRLTIAEHAYNVLKETDNNGISYGDSYLCHTVAEAAGMKHDGWRTENNVLNAIDRSNKGLFHKRYYRSRRGIARIFYRFDADPFSPLPPAQPPPAEPAEPGGEL